MAEKRQIPVGERVDDNAVSDNGAERGDFLPAWYVFQEVVEGESRQCERLHREDEAIQ